MLPAEPLEVISGNERIPILALDLTVSGKSLQGCIKSPGGYILLSFGIPTFSFALQKVRC